MSVVCLAIVFSNPVSGRASDKLPVVKSEALVLPKSTGFSNPYFEGADPDILVTNGAYWLYTTKERNPQDVLLSYSSSDLRSWTPHGGVLNLKDVLWAENDGAQVHAIWAPTVFHSHDKYYLYFSVGPQNPTPSRIGVALSNSPSGPFVDSRKPLVIGGKDFEAIDPMVFRDPKSRQAYLYCGGSEGAKLHAYELNDDLITVKREIPVDTPPEFTEGAFMHLRNGIYYLSYSHGRWNDDSYCVCYSTASTPLGPWKYKGKILESNSEHSGPGHHAFVQESSTGKWYIVYHRWNGANRDGKMPKTRSIAIDLLRYNEAGEIIPVQMTDAGVPASSSKDDCGDETIASTH